MKKIKDEAVKLLAPGFLKWHYLALNHVLLKQKSNKKPSRAKNFTSTQRFSNLKK